MSNGFKIALMRIAILFGTFSISIFWRMYLDRKP